MNRSRPPFRPEPTPSTSGVGKLNMRSASAANFTLDDLSKIVATARGAGVKKLPDGQHRRLRGRDRRGARRDRPGQGRRRRCRDRLDLAAILYARRIGQEVHISTQCNISNSEAVRFFAQWADTVVLARELTLEQVAEIHRKIAGEEIRGPRGELVQIEMFAHGAPCACPFRAECYLALRNELLGQPRRVPPAVPPQIHRHGQGDRCAARHRRTLRPLAQDLCTVDFLDKMIAAGVRVLKIEGRARGAEYVRRVVGCYDEALRALEAGSYTPALAAELKERLRTVFNRGFWEGYYAGRPVVEHSPAYGSSATQRKVYVGKVVNFYKKLSVAEVLVEAAPLSVGEPIFFLGATTGVAEQTLEELHGPDGSPADSVAQGELCAIRTPGVIRRGDQLYKFVPADKV